MNKHTPGPWKVNDIYIENRDGTLELVEILTNDESFNDDGDLIGEDLANANLVSAAPDLLYALEALCSKLPCKAKSPNAYETYHAKVELDLARAAIAKARGEA